MSYVYLSEHVYFRLLRWAVYRQFTGGLKGTKREKLHAMHVKELIKTNYSEW